MFGKNMLKGLQEKAAKIKAQIDNLEATGESGGGLVKVTISGMGQIKSIKISDEAMKEDSEFLEDLILAASNQANEKLEAERSKIVPMDGLF